MVRESALPLFLPHPAHTSGTAPPGHAPGRCVTGARESQHAGFDIGMDRAIREWLDKHYTAGAAAHRPPQTPPPSS